jgi:hypothetical protein
MTQPTQERISDAYAEPMIGLAPAPMPSVVVFDDGALTRRAIERIARYAGRAIVLGGARCDALCNLLASHGVLAERGDRPATGIADALTTAVESGSALVAIGPPLDGRALVTEIDAWLANTGTTGCIVHTVAPAAIEAMQVAAWTQASGSWATGVASAFARALHERVDVAATATPEAVGARVESAHGDLLLVCAKTAAPLLAVPSQVSRPPALTAAEIIHVILTDRGLVVTNRTRFSVDIRVRLGSVASPDRDLGAVEASLAPRSEVVYGPEELSFLAAEEAPVPVLRQWSHEAEIVYESGSRRINSVDIRYLDEEGKPLATMRHSSRPGLVVGVTATEIARAVGAILDSAGRRYAAMAAERPATGGEVVSALVSAAGRQA